MSSESGHYVITAKDGFPLNRSPIEDRSLRPKKMHILDSDTAAMCSPLISVKDGDKYTMKCIGADVGYSEQTGTVSAALMPDVGVTAGKLTFEEASGGHIIGLDRKHFAKGGKAYTGHHVKLGPKSEAVVFDIHKINH